MEAMTTAERDTAPDGPTPDGSPPQPMPQQPRRIRLLAAVAAVALALDVVSKILVAANITGGRTIRTLAGAVYIVQTRNSGAAFSVGTGATVILTLIAVAIIAVIIRSAKNLRSAGWAVALGLILGGALGNLADRIFRAPGVGRGHVVDWISVFAPDGHVWPIFNLADSAIVCGAILAAVLALRGIDMDGSGSRDASG